MDLKDILFSGEGIVKMVKAKWFCSMAACPGGGW